MPLPFLFSLPPRCSTHLRVIGDQLEGVAWQQALSVDVLHSHCGSSQLAEPVGTWSALGGQLKETEQHDFAMIALNLVARHAPLALKHLVDFQIALLLPAGQVGVAAAAVAGVAIAAGVNGGQVALCVEALTALDFRARTLPLCMGVRTARAMHFPANYCVDSSADSCTQLGRGLHGGGGRESCQCCQC